MNVRLIACEMLRDELELAMERTGVTLPVTWMQKGLHNSPSLLRSALQTEIDRSEPDCRRILFSMAYCGGAMDGLCSSSAQLVVPRFDDCVRLLLTPAPGRPPAADCRCLYFTRQWLDSDGYLLRDFDRYRRTYGEKKARRIIQAMIGHYEGYRLIDTGAYSVAAYEDRCRKDATELGLAYGCQAGTVRILEKLLLQQLDKEFVVAPPGTALTQSDFLRI